MGRTIPSYRMVLEEEIAGWKKFAEALRQEDQRLFEDMVNACRLYASASGAATRPVASEAMFMAILLTHQKTLQELRQELEQLRASRNSPSNQDSSKV